MNRLDDWCEMQKNYHFASNDEWKRRFFISVSRPNENNIADLTGWIEVQGLSMPLIWMRNNSAIGHKYPMMLGEKDRRFPRLHDED